jgi:Uncharacterized protein conserved in bacteria
VTPRSSRHRHYGPVRRSATGGPKGLPTRSFLTPSRKKRSATPDMARHAAVTTSNEYAGMSDRRFQNIDWHRIATELDIQGWALMPHLMEADECDDMASMYEKDAGFRSRVVMARHGFGQGEYRYFAYPLPALIHHLRTTLYAHLAPIANQWHERMRIDTRFPNGHAEFLERCHAAGQNRPTPLLLQYGPGDYNCLHQDLYGEHVFPLQVAILLSEPGMDFDGGEFILTEQRPRMQTRPVVVPLSKGDAVVFAVNSRPHRGSKGDYRVMLRHGVSKVRDGRRHTVGIIFHDAT